MKKMLYRHSEWVEKFKRHSESAKRDLNYILCNNLDTLIWLANMAALEIHIMLSRPLPFENPDLVLFDLDPEPPLNYNAVVDVAFSLRDKLSKLNLRSFVKTSGKKGWHIIVPIVKEYTFQNVRDFVHQIGKYLARECEVVVTEYPNQRSRVHCI